MSPISDATVNALIQPNPGAVTSNGDVAVIGAVQLELVDQLQARVTLRRHGSGMASRSSSWRPA
jgi:hypothetical protein